jgi:hypothetical protein
VDIYTEALLESLETMPYNSAAAYHEVFGDAKPDPRLGASCIYQTMDAARRAEERGAPPAVLLQDERHVAAVFYDHGEVVVLDPYLLHLRAIRFPRTEVRAGVSTIEVPAAPERRNLHGAILSGRLDARLKVTRGGGHVIRLAYSRYGPAKGAYTVNRYFSLRSNSLFNMRSFVGDIRVALTHPEQNSLSVRAFIPAIRGTAEAILPLRGYASTKFTADDLWMRSSQGAVSKSGRGESEQVWEALTEAIGLGRIGVEEHLVSAARVYQQIADPAKDLAAYPLENE